MTDEELLTNALKSSDPGVLRLAHQLLTNPQRYKADPVGFCRNVLNVRLWAKQVEIAEALVKHRRVLVKSANAVGKSFTAACLALWFFLTHAPSITLLTAPTYRQVQDVTFKEIRRLYGSRPGLYQKLARVETSPDHYIHGFTTTDATAFQGIHGDNLFVIFEECVGVHADFWEAANSILIGGSNCYFLAVCNPTDTSSQAYLEEQSGKWHIITISAFDHPNVQAELEGKPPSIPGAIRLEQLATAIREWCQPVTSPAPGDIAFQGRHYSPGPIAEARLLGRFPSQGSYSVFSEVAFDVASSVVLATNREPFHIGCDVARFGDDMTTIHVRRGSVSLHHESHNKRDTVFTAGRLKELANEYGRKLALECNTSADRLAEVVARKAREVPIKVDDAGVGGGVVDQRDGYNFVGVNNASRATTPEYPNKRSEGLFLTAQLMADGKLSLAALPKSVVAEFRRQALSITYKLDAQGRRVAEPKDAIKKRINRSPDDLDALILAYLPVGETFMMTAPTIAPTPRNRVWGLTS